MTDTKIFDLINKEKERQASYVELIASENFVSEDILRATGSILTNKYAEGYPHARYYGGCEIVDQIEDEARDRLKALFNVKFANVQPHSGSQANAAAMFALLNPGDKILGLSLHSGGHLTHGTKVNFSGKIFQSYTYDVNRETELLDYDEIRKIALEVKPKLIITGYSAYSRIIDFKKFKEIANEVGAYLMADIAHIAGLIAAGAHPSPVNYADVITSTTHKILRGPRSGIIMTNNEEIAKLVDKAIFPGTQGGPLLHVIAAKAICFKEAATPEYKKYAFDLIDNCKAMANEFKNKGARIVSGGTDNHLFMIDVKKSFNISGQRAVDLLFKANIIVNKNSIPFDEEKPTVTSGIRIGTAAMTTKGFNKEQFIKLADIIFSILNSNSDEFANSKREEILRMLNK